MALPDDSAPAPDDRMAVAGIRQGRATIGLFIAAGVLVAVGTAGFLLLLAAVSGGSGPTGADRAILAWLVDQRTPALTTAMSVTATVSGPVGMPIIVLVTTVVWSLTSRRLWRPVLLASAMVIGVLLTFVFTHLAGRPRPPEEFMLMGFDPTSSFPSGHAVGAGDFLLAGGYLLCSRIRSVARIVLCTITAVAGIVWVDLCRLYLGYHWFTDVAASLGLSIAVLGLVIAADAWRQGGGERNAHIRAKGFHL
ncbi:phosphatase PAP2 family protein [Pseudarthrobacter sp. P1]|uniref:phosphatase PAP2 family protein n=1 Tax=Pseudarthrobacter sp. P1 TaxID=3418418 RepID=UPI003CFA0637